MMDDPNPGPSAGPKPALPGEQTFTATVEGRTFTFRSGRLAGLAAGAVTVQLGDTLVLAAVTASNAPREGIDFFPLSVDLEERLYAAGRIPGSFFRREGRPSEVAILVSRLIDRPLRPLFPKGFRNDVQVVVTALSSDSQNYLDIPSLVAASAALTVSDIPFGGPVGAVRVGLIDGQLVVNPTAGEMADSRLDLRVAGTADAILMVECGAKEVDEDLMTQALLRAHEAMQPLIAVQNEMRAALGKPKRTVTTYALPEPLAAHVRAHIGHRIDGAMDSSESKEARAAALDALREEWMTTATAAYAEHAELTAKEFAAAYDDLLKERVRRRILDQGVRPDGRRPTDLRALSAEVGLLPRAHGSALFQRGETQVLSIATVGTIGDEQRLDTLRPEETKRFMHHYNFPAFSTGETFPNRGPKRREIGHGALAETALKAVLPLTDDYPYSIRVVSEVLSSNGSTSMASVCAGSLSLMDAGIESKAPVAGIAMGLITDGDRIDNYVVLTDIQGMEDHLGDMDFKVAGTAEGITALQMDIKVSGLSEVVLKKALAQARDARMKILDVMNAALSAPRVEMSPYAPRVTSIKIDPEFIGKIIGPGGKTIRSLEADTGAKIDILPDGTVHVAAIEGAAGDAAIERIRMLTTGPELGTIYTGKVVRTTDFGAFVEILPGIEGMVHISQLSTERINRVEDEVEMGDEVQVMVTDVADGKVRLSRLAVLAGWSLDEARENDRPSRPRSDRGDRGDRGGPPRRGGPGGPGGPGGSGGGDRGRGPRY